MTYPNINLRLDPNLLCAPFQLESVWAFLQLLQWVHISGKTEGNIDCKRINAYIIQKPFEGTI